MKKIIILTIIIASVALLVLSAKPYFLSQEEKEIQNDIEDEITTIEKPKHILNVNGEIISKNDYTTILKVWGTHKERGFAYGYILGDKIKMVYDGYVGKAMKQNLATAKKIVASNQFLKIDAKYIEECKGIVDGMDSAGVNVDNFSYIDIIIANSFLDLQALTKSNELSNGCSSLMAWGSATQNTELKGKSIITRNLDWTAASKLINNNLILISIPSEKDEQPWLTIGYIGNIGALSGTNKSGLSVFQHVMYDKFDVKKFSKYEPVWFSIRKALEQKDFDGSGKNDVNDLKSVILKNKDGYASGYILTAMAPSTAGADSLIAMVAELGPDKPYFTFRNSDFDDKIEGDILYAANYPISRNNEHRYCTRYDNTIRSFDNKTQLDPAKSWDIMATSSCLKDVNLQMIQIIPELSILKLSVWKDGKGAFNFQPETYNLKDFFSPITIKK